MIDFLNKLINTDFANLDFQAIVNELVALLEKLLGVASEKLELE